MTYLTMDEWKQRVKAFLRYGKPTQKMIVCEGEAGCGKSEITVQAIKEVVKGHPIICPGLGGQQQEDWLSLSKLVQDGDGNPKVLQAVMDNIIPTKKLLDNPDYQIEVSLPSGETIKKIVIPWLIDETFTGMQTQANQLRSLLTFRKVGSVEIPVETYFIGTTNPESAEYSSRRAIDKAVLDRIEVCPVKLSYEEHMRFLTSQEDYPDVCRMFLRMNASDKLWSLASARFWHYTFGGTWHELSCDPGMSEDTRIKLFGAAITQHFDNLASYTMSKAGKVAPLSIMSSFKTFINHGDDPSWYPLRGADIINAGPKELGSALEVVGKWLSDNKFGLLAATVGDLVDTLMLNRKVSESALKNIRDVSVVAGPLFAAKVYKALVEHDVAYGSEANSIWYEMLNGSKIYDEVRDMVSAHNKLVESLGG